MNAPRAFTEGVGSKRIYTRNFWMLCCSSLLFFASFNMLLPQLPAYLTSLGGPEYKGLIIALFTLTAMISRPFSGKLADTIGRIPIIFAGAAVCVVCSLCYPVLTTVAAFLALRLVHGFSTGFTPTGQAAYLSDIIPPERRGEAMGIIGTAGTLGMAAGPSVGGALAANFGVNSVFYCSAGFAFLSVLIILNIRETLRARQSFSWSLLRIGRRDIFEPRVLVPCVLMVLCTYAYGALFTLLPDYGDYFGIRNTGPLFTTLMIASLMIRLIGGRASDRFGRRPVVMVAAGVILISMLVISFADAVPVLFAGVFLYGLGQGTISPTLLAWATDLSDAANRGRALASLYIFMELGIGIGALGSGLIFANDPARFAPAFLVCGALALFALIYLLATRKESRLA